MLQPKLVPVQPLAPPPKAAATTRRRQPSPFFGALDAVLVDDPGEFSFDGALSLAEADAAWTWLARDVAPDLIVTTAEAEVGIAALVAATPALLSRARAASAAAAADPEQERRLRVQLGGNDNRQRLPLVLGALRCLPLLGKARAFGRAVDGMSEEPAIVTALDALPRQDASASALLMMAAVGEVMAPERLTVAATRIAGDTSELAIERAGFGALIEALLAHAQNMLPRLERSGTFADADLTCRSVERFHRLIRSIGAYVDLVPRGRWATISASLTRTVSARLEPGLRDLPTTINRALRKGPADRLDGDDLLAALNGTYLLAAIREARDSLALNEAFDESWSRSGQVLELHLTRSLDALRDDPADANMAARVDAGIKMAEIRFGLDYADVLRRARAGFDRRASA